MAKSIKKEIKKAGCKMENSINPISIQTIAILGGTGKEGKGLGYRWAKAGFRILIGSRQKEKAEAAAVVLKSMVKGDCDVVGLTNDEAAVMGDIVVLSVPYAAQKELLSQLKDKLTGKVLINVVVPLVPPKVSVVQMPPAGSAAKEAQFILGENTHVVAAFQNISFENLLEEGIPDCDVLVCGGRKQDRALVLQLVQAAQMVGWDGGPIENAVVVEGLTSVLIGLNKQYGVRSSGIRFTGLPRPEKIDGKF